MIQYICDKCGKEFKINSMQQAILPMYKVLTVRYSPYVEEINLCPLCEKDLDNWIHNKKRNYGYWKLTSDETGESCICSECGYENGENWASGRDIPFCANCGADMKSMYF